MRSPLRAAGNEAASNTTINYGGEQEIAWPAGRIGSTLAWRCTVVAQGSGVGPLPHRGRVG